MDPGDQEYGLASTACLFVCLCRLDPAIAVCLPNPESIEALPRTHGSKGVEQSFIVSLFASVFKGC